MNYSYKRFQKLCEEFTQKEQAILGWKAGEYTDGGDRLLNFRQVANFTNQTPADVALTYLLKHIQSITLAVNSKRYNWAWTSKSGEGLKQRIADARNYLLLLAACIEEETERQVMAQNAEYWDKVMKEMDAKEAGQCNDKMD